MSQAIQAREQLIDDPRDFDPRDFVRAAAAGETDALAEAIAAGADVNAAVDYGETALIAAAAGGHADAVRLLLRSGADVDARRGDSFNALSIAAFFGHKEGVRALLDYSADVTSRDRTGMTARGWALSKGHLEVANLLRDAESAATRRESGVVSPAPADALPTEPVRFEERGARPATPVLILEAGAANGSTPAGAAVSNAEADGETTLMAPARSPVVGPAQTPHGRKWDGEASAVVAAARAARPARRPAGSYVGDDAGSSYSLSRLILLALISGLTAGATFFTVNWMITPAATEAQPPPPAVVATPQPAPQEAPKTEKPKQKAQKPAAQKPGMADFDATPSAAGRAAAPAHARADRRDSGKPETSRTRQPVLISAQGESTSGGRPVSERVALPVAPPPARRPTQSAGGAGGEGSVTVTPRATATPRRTEVQTRTRPAEPLALPPQPAAATPKKVIRWP
ncbi:MAG TPA: ankyrin repeat domain-containing protein [Pyrinomonadaceae bacterium]|jgi:hypothetical protein|nr:ankyrin repeat domain-containing protein [Pyrinomonadaceae bacterium]